MPAKPIPIWCIEDHELNNVQFKVLVIFHRFLTVRLLVMAFVTCILTAVS